jgi:hypothetical protein
VRIHRPIATLLASAAVVLAGCGPDAGPVAPRTGSLLAAAGTAGGRVTRRSIEEFVAAQPNYCLLPGNPNNCDNSIPGIDLQAFVDPKTGNLIVLDYPGIAAAYLAANGGPDLGTTHSGTVTERVLNDGRALITVVLHTENALTYVEDFNAPIGEAIRLGATPTQVLAGAPVALGSSTLRLTYIAPAPGMPLVAVSQVVYFEADKYEIVRLSFDAQAEGVLHAASGYPEGTLGRVRAKEVDRHTPGLLRRGDPYRVEYVRLSAIGR